MRGGARYLRFAMTRQALCALWRRQGLGQKFLFQCGAMMARSLQSACDDGIALAEDMDKSCLIAGVGALPVLEVCNDIISIIIISL
jgi:hypothetical protein